MKRLLILLFVSITTLLISQETITLVKKGDVIKEDGYWVSRSSAETFFKNGQLVKDMSADIASLKQQISLQNMLIKEKDFQIGLLNTQVASFKSINEEYQKYIKEFQTAAIQNKILTITTSIGFGISLASLVGIGVYAILSNVK